MFFDIFCQGIISVDQFGCKIYTNSLMSRRFEQIYQKNEGKEHFFSKKDSFPFSFFSFLCFRDPILGKSERNRCTSSHLTFDIDAAFMGLHEMFHY